MGHDGHLMWHGSKSLHGDHSMGNVVARHNRDPNSRCCGNRDQARIMNVTLNE